VQLPRRAIGSAETVADLVKLLTAAPRQRVSSRRDEPATQAAALAPRERLGTPAPHVRSSTYWPGMRSNTASHSRDWCSAQNQRCPDYAQLRNAARSVAGSLQRAGVQPGARVALMLPTALNISTRFFGVLLAGAVTVPIYPPARPSQIEEHVHRSPAF